MRLSHAGLVVSPAAISWEHPYAHSSGARRVEDIVDRRKSLHKKRWLELYGYRRGFSFVKPYIIFLHGCLP